MRRRACGELRWMLLVLPVQYMLSNQDGTLQYSIGFIVTEP